MLNFCTFTHQWPHLIMGQVFFGTDPWPRDVTHSHLSTHLTHDPLTHCLSALVCWALAQRFGSLDGFEGISYLSATNFLLHGAGAWFTLLYGPCGQCDSAGAFVFGLMLAFPCHMYSVFRPACPGIMALLGRKKLNAESCGRNNPCRKWRATNCLQITAFAANYNACGIVRARRRARIGGYSACMGLNYGWSSS